MYVRYARYGRLGSVEPSENLPHKVHATDARSEVEVHDSSSGHVNYIHYLTSTTC